MKTAHPPPPADAPSGTSNPSASSTPPMPSSPPPAAPSPAPNTFLWAFSRDWRIALRRRADTLNLIGFFVLACLMVPFAVGPETQWLSRIGPGMIWVMALLAQLTALPMLFANDHQDGSLEHMLASGRSPTALVGGKLLAIWMVSALPLILVTPALGLMLSMDLDRTLLLMLTLLLGTPTLLILGAIGAALTLGLRSGGALLALLCLPLYVPVLIFGSGAVDMVSAGLSANAHLSLLAAGMLMALWGGPFMVALALRTSLE
ncbi:MAG: heme exporter protein CcmB [Lautropia sp.]|nr:heme exporter protein CcmB [Lautropia sp.]